MRNSKLHGRTFESLKNFIQSTVSFLHSDNRSLFGEHLSLRNISTKVTAEIQKLVDSTIKEINLNTEKSLDSFFLSLLQEGEQEGTFDFSFPFRNGNLIEATMRIISSTLAVAYFIHLSKYEESTYNYSIQIFKNLGTIIQDKENEEISEYFLPLLRKNLQEIRFISKRIDSTLAVHGIITNEYQGKFFGELQEKTRTFSSSRFALLIVVVAYMQFNFSLNDTQSSARLSKSRDGQFLTLVCGKNNVDEAYSCLNELGVDSLGGPLFGVESALEQNFHIQDLLAYEFYRGRLFMVQDSVKQANTLLNDCLRHTLTKFPDSDPMKFKNARAILSYLIPVRLRLGRLPTIATLEKYNLKEYIDLVYALKVGHIGLYESVLEKYMDLFINRGIYLLLEKCKFRVYRNLIHHVYNFEGSSTTNQISTSLILCAFNFSNNNATLALTSSSSSSTLQNNLSSPPSSSAAEDNNLNNNYFNLNRIAYRTLLGEMEEMDEDEVECIVANVIGHNLLKAVIVHKARKIGCKPEDPFLMEKK